MRRILITGGAGFIGSNLVRYWLSAHPVDRIVVLDGLKRGGRLENLPRVDRHVLRFVEGDIRDTENVARVMRDERVDVVIHLAAETHVDRSISSPLEFVATNVVGTASLLEAAREVWIPRTDPHRFHYVSTDEVYGPRCADDAPVDEQAPRRPTSPYAASKAGGDLMVDAYARTYGLFTSTTFSCNNYGPRQDPEKLIPKAITRALRGQDIPVYGNGMNVRDWMFVEDHCVAVDACLTHPVAGQCFNVSAGQVSTNLALVRHVCGLIDQAFRQRPMLRETHPASPAARGLPIEDLITFVADRPAHDLRYAIDSSALERATGFRAAVTLRQGLQETVDWYLENPEWLGRAIPQE